MDLGTLDAQGYFELLQRLEGSGYAKDEDGVRASELRAWAEIAARATEALNDATNNLFLQSATTTLDLMERTLFLLQGSSLPVAQRRARLLAYKRASPLNEVRMRASFGTHLASFTGVTQRPSNPQAVPHGAAPATGLLVGSLEPLAMQPQQQQDLSLVLGRGLPARAISGGVAQRDAVWGDALLPAAIKLVPAVTVPTQTKHRSAPLEFLPGQRVTREDWLELQSMLCHKSYGFTLDQHKQGRTFMCFIPALGAGAAYEFPERAIGMQNRFVQACGLVSNAMLSDPTLAADAERVWLPTSKLGPAGGGYSPALLTVEQPPVVTGIVLRVNASGGLEVANTGGAAKAVVLMVRVTAAYVPGSGISTQPWIDAVQPRSADVSELYLAQVIADLDPGEFDDAPAGALRRVVSSGPLFHAAGYVVPQCVVLDTSEDWRNRYVQVASTGHYDALAADFPAPSIWGQIAGESQAAFAPRLFYTGPGSASGSGVQEPFQQPLTHALKNTGSGNGKAPSDIWLFARDTDGALMCEMKQGVSANQAASMLALVTATERKETGISVVTRVPVHATQVQTIDLEQPQNCGVYAQGQQGNVPRYRLADPAPRALPTCPPLGVIADGASPVRPVRWLVRERLGAADDGLYEVRQKLLGQRRRLTSLWCLAGTTTPLDDFNMPAQLAAGAIDQADYRDRFVWVEGRLSASNITVAATTQISDAAATPFLALLYTGPSTIESELALTSQGTYSVLIAPQVWLQFEFTRGKPGQGFHSRLVVQNKSAADVYVNCSIEASGFLGLTDRRAAGQPV
jgi:hypothetical protein